MRVSIILPVYNVSRYLRRCLDSIARQTFRDFEVIAVDDGSTDDSGRQLDDYEASFPMRRIHQPNRGLSAARNAAMAEATGEYLLMVDSDDCIHPRLLEFTVAAADGAGLDLVLFDYRRIDDAGVGGIMSEWNADASTVASEEIPGSFFDWFVRARRWPCVWQFLYRRSVIADRTFIPGILYEDIPFAMSLLASGIKGGYIRKELYCYAITNGSITGYTSYLGRIAGYETGLRFLRKELNEHQYRLFIGRSFAYWLRDLWRHVRAIGDADERRKQFGALALFLRTMFADDLARWGDFRLPWRIRFAFLILSRGAWRR